MTLTPRPSSLGSRFLARLAAIAGHPRAPDAAPPQPIPVARVPAAQPDLTAGERTVIEYMLAGGGVARISQTSGGPLRIQVGKREMESGRGREFDETMAALLSLTRRGLVQRAGGSHAGEIFRLSERGRGT